MTIRVVWSFAILGMITTFVLTGHPTAAFLCVFLFPNSTEKK